MALNDTAKLRPAVCHRAAAVPIPSLLRQSLSPAWPLATRSPSPSERERTTIRVTARGKPSHSRQPAPGPPIQPSRPRPTGFAVRSRSLFGEGEVTLPRPSAGRRSEQSPRSNSCFKLHSPPNRACCPASRRPIDRWRRPATALREGREDEQRPPG